MSQIVYNGITLTHVSTRSIEFVPVLSDDGMDTLYTKVTFDVSGIVSPPVSPAAGGENATQTVARIEHYLNQKKAAFQYSVDGQPLVTWLGGPDAKNGPHPKGVRVLQVVGSALYHVSFGIELNINTCQADPRIPYVSHRWSEEVTLDDAARTTKVRRGKIVTRGDVFVNPDSLRGLVMPPIDNGFLREESRYVLQSDGLALEYSFRDKEQFVMPPAPSWKAEGTYIESTPTLAERWGEVRLHLRGSKQTDKGELLKTAILVATTKLNRDLFRDDKNVVIMVGAIQENMYEPDITVTIKARLRPFPNRFNRLAMDLSRFTDFPLGSQPGQNPATLPDAGTRGTAGLKLVAAALNDPCLSQTVLRTGGSEPSGQSILAGQGAPELAQVTMRAVLPTDTAALYAANPDPGIYTHYHVAIRTIQNRHMLQLPVGKAGEQPVVVQTAAPTQKKIVSWTAGKIGDAPKLPDPDLGPNFVLSKSVIDTEEVVPSGDGVNLTYRVAGKYVYFVKNYGQAVLTAGMPPWMNESAKPDVLKAVSQFGKGIIDLGLLGYGTVFNAAGGFTVRLTNLPGGQ